MAMDINILATSFKNNLLNDPDSKYPAGAATPTDSDELDAFAYYMAKSVINHLSGNAQTEAGIPTSDGASTLQSADGILK